MAFKEIYKELADKLKNIEGIKWVDLWTNQTDYFEEEIPFPMPAVFIEFQAMNIATVGNNDQNIDLQVILRLAVETNAESYEGSYNQDKALSFFDLLVELHKAIQGESGETYSSLNRVAINQEIIGGNIIQYAVTYQTEIRDYSSEREPLEHNNFKIDI